jgi:glucan phosphoethanolaminetransferase (alkaline phosphatase superfamily)
MDIFSAFGLSASAGLNAYIPLLIVGLLARYTDTIQLSPPWDTLTDPWVLLVVAVLLLIEILADKFPAVNHLNDAIQTLVRPIAGAIVFAASAHVISDVHPVVAMICGLFVAGAVHGVKALAIRPAVTATTGGTANPIVSTLEDIVATVLSIVAILIPVVLGALICLVTAWIIWLIWRRINREAKQT